MKIQLLKNYLAATAVIIGLGFSAATLADGTKLPPLDSFLSTMINKSMISGSIQKDATGNIIVDANGNMMFDYTGKVYSVATNPMNSKLMGLPNVVGSVKGQASFPMSFAQLAMGMKAYLDGVGPKPTVPATIDFTCNHCTLVIGDSTYITIADATTMFDAATIEAMRMKGRAFTGEGPVEVGQLSRQSMSVRMAGCSAVVGIAGSDKGKLGSLCMNSTLTFDLTGINLAAPMSSTINGNGNSNCITVMHTPLAM
jgi:hypothetical protein